MALVKKIEKKAIFNNWDVIKYQLITHCFINKISVSDSDIDTLTLLAQEGKVELSYFCHDAAYEHDIFKSSQSVRNSLNKCEKLGLIIKDPDNKKLILLNPELKIVSEGTILLSFNFLSHHEHKEY